MDCHPSTELVISVSYEMKKENPCMVFHVADPFSRPAYTGEGEIPWFYPDGYTRSITVKKSLNDWVDLEVGSNFFNQKMGSIRYSSVKDIVMNEYYLMNGNLKPEN